MKYIKNKKTGKFQPEITENNVQIQDGVGKDGFTEKAANFFITEIAANTAPWMKNWKANEYLYPQNGESGKLYSGINALFLEAVCKYHFNSDDPRFLTFIQCRESGFHIKKGSTGFPVCFHASVSVDKDGKQCDKKSPEYVKDKAIHRNYIVFHASQIEGIPPYEKLLEVLDKNNKQIEPIENILINSKAKIYHDSIDSNSYSINRDEIHLTAKYTFHTLQDYYSTALHELAHWTGHPSRMNREFGKSMNSPLYAKEELRAEIASYLICKELNVDFNPQNHIAYLASWQQELKDGPTGIITATHEANKIKEFIMPFNHVIVNEKMLSQDNESEHLKVTVSRSRH